MKETVPIVFFYCIAAAAAAAAAIIIIMIDAVAVVVHIFIYIKYSSFNLGCFWFVRWTAKKMHLFPYKCDYVYMHLKLNTFWKKEDGNGFVFLDFFFCFLSLSNMWFLYKH